LGRQAHNDTIGRFILTGIDDRHALYFFTRLVDLPCFSTVENDADEEAFRCLVACKLSHQGIAFVLKRAAQSLFAADQIIAVDDDIHSLYDSATLRNSQALREKTLRGQSLELLVANERVVAASSRAYKTGEFLVAAPNSLGVVKIAKNRYNLNNLMLEGSAGCLLQ
jgi:hypothetical protein